MVAAGGGGSGGGSESGDGGHAGGLSGSPGLPSIHNSIPSLPGNQTFGCKLFEGSPGLSSNEPGGSGGSGYYGGCGGTTDDRIKQIWGSSGGAGGSSFISGHEGCIAMDERGNPLGTSIYPSKIYFTDTEMISGNEAMPSITSPVDKENNGHDGDGYARITFISSYFECTTICSYSIFYIMTLCFQFFLKNKRFYNTKYHQYFKNTLASYVD